MLQSVAGICAQSAIESGKSNVTRESLVATNVLVLAVLVMVTSLLSDWPTLNSSEMVKPVVANPSLLCNPLGLAQTRSPVKISNFSIVVFQPKP